MSFSWSPAALLVFAISPLQRFADRFAAKAVPGGAEAGAAAEEQFRGLVEATLADGEITPDEERHLRKKAEELGLKATRAYDLRREVEEEDAGGEPA